jgi:hypothetical protein
MKIAKTKTLRVFTETGIVELSEQIDGQEESECIGISESGLSKPGIHRFLYDAMRMARNEGFRMAGDWEQGDGFWRVAVACGPTPTRTVRIEDSLWEKAKVRAMHKGTNVSAIIVEAVHKFVESS